MEKIVFRENFRQTLFRASASSLIKVRLKMYEILLKFTKETLLFIAINIFNC